MKTLFRLLCLALALALTPVARAGDKQLKVEFLDVGQGDAILLTSPEGKVALIDGGPSAKFVNLLRKRRVKAIDLVVATHHHADHIVGLVGVVKRYKPRFYLDPGSSHTTATYRRLLQAVEDAGTQFLTPQDK